MRGPIPIQSSVGFLGTETPQMLTVFQKENSLNKEIFFQFHIAIQHFLTLEHDWHCSLYGSS